VTSYPSPERKLSGFRELFREDFDVARLGRFVLGRFWPMFTPAEQQEFLGLFENLVRRSKVLCTLSASAST